MGNAFVVGDTTAGKTIHGVVLDCEAYSPTSEREHEDFPVLDNTEDYLVFDAKRNPTFPLADVKEFERHGPDPLDGVTKHEVGDPWAERFEKTLSISGFRWDAMARPLFAGAANEEWCLAVVGGLVRNVLLGADPDNPDDRRKLDDLDIAGTAPAGDFRRICFQTQLEEADEEGWRRNAFWHMVTTSRCVVHVRQVFSDRNGAWLEREPTLQYAPLKRFPNPRRKTNEAEYLLGSSFREDSIWRDIRYNTLMYDPHNRLLIDPTGHGLEDLGLSGLDLKDGDPRECLRGTIRVSPQPIPEGATDAYVAKSLVARIVKQAVDLGEIGKAWEDAADWGPVHAWWKDSGPRVRELAKDRGQNGSAGDVLVKALQDLVGSSRNKGRVVLAAGAYDKPLGADFARLLEDLGWPFGTRNRSAGSRLRLRGTALAPLVTMDGRQVIDHRATEETSEGTVEAANEVFGDRLIGQGYEHAIVEVAIRTGQDRIESICVLGLTSKDQTTYVELRGSGPIPITEEQFDALRRSEAAP